MAQVELQTDAGWISLSDLVKMRLGSLPLRSAAVESGVTASTLCRVTQGYNPDVVILARLLKWLGMPLWLRVC